MNFNIYKKVYSLKNMNFSQFDNCLQLSVTVEIFETYDDNCNYTIVKMY